MLQTSYDLLKQYLLNYTMIFKKPCALPRRSLYIAHRPNNIHVIFVDERKIINILLLCLINVNIVADATNATTDTINDCRIYFNFLMPSELVEIGKNRFEGKFINCSNLLYYFGINKIM